MKLKSKELLFGIYPLLHEVLPIGLEGLSHDFLKNHDKPIILQISRQLPGPGTILVERNLDSNKDLSPDISLGYSPLQLSNRLYSKQFAKTLKQKDFVLSIKPLLQALTQQEGNLFKSRLGFGCEYDVTKISNDLDISRPNVFLDTRYLAASDFLNILQLALDHLYINPELHIKAIKHVLSLISDSKKICYLGLMLARDHKSIRINLRDLSIQEATIFLESFHELSMHKETLQKAIKLAYSLSDSVVMCIDIGKYISPRIGFEQYISKLDQKNNYKSILETLIEKEIADKETAHSFLNSPKVFFPHNTKLPWPECLLIHSLYYSGTTFNHISRDINHIKLIHAENGKLQVKGYLSIKTTYKEIHKIPKKTKNS